MMSGSPLTTGVPRDHVRFCRKRHEKADHAKEIGLTHFIDDRLDVLEHLRGLVPQLILFGERQPETPPWVFGATDWRSVERWFAANPVRSQAS